LLLIHPVRTQKLQIRDDVVNVVVCQHDDFEPASEVFASSRFGARRSPGCFIIEIGGEQPAELSALI
jgi:hypothetical protein